MSNTLIKESKLIEKVLTKEPVEFKAIFEELITERVKEKVESLKESLAKTLFNKKD